jgi:membrane protein implicated in regulation of membrane protease activity
MTLSARLWQWVRRIAAWVGLALLVVTPGALWLRERARRQQAEGELEDEQARGRRAQALADRTQAIQQAHAEEVRQVVADTEAAAAPHEAAVAEVQAVDTEDPATWVDLASRLDRTSRRR